MHRIETLGFTLLLHGDNYLEEEIVRSGVWEPLTTRYIRQTLKPGMVAVDVGANIGYFSLLMASLTGREGRVHAFEPYPGYAARMRDSLAANNFEQIELHQAALSDKWGYQTLYKGLASARMCLWSHEDPAFRKVHDTVTVPCMPFDDYARGTLRQLDLIKIDVDGHEMKVLHGARESIERHRPSVLIELYEEALRDAGSNVDQVLEFFTRRGYVPYSEQGQRLNVSELARQVVRQARISTNVVFRGERSSPVSVPQGPVRGQSCRPVIDGASQEMVRSHSRLVLGLVVNRRFHEENKWCSATTFHLVEGLKRRFQRVYIENQSDYERCLGDLDVLISMEPGWAAPLLEYVRTPALQAKLATIPSYILYSDPHANKWRQDYFISNGLDYVLSFYRAPFLSHFRALAAERMVHFPWAVPDDWIVAEPAPPCDRGTIVCFGASQGPAYSLRNWCRRFPFVTSAPNSGVENRVMTDVEYVKWLRGCDAAIAAGSDAPEYRLTVPKYFEIPAAGALLFAQETDDLDGLGFQHLENCIIFNRSNFEALARAYLARPQEYLEIRRRGCALIRRRHALSRRLDFLERHIAEHRRQRRPAPPAPVLPDSPLPHVLFVVDMPNWAHDFKTNNLMRVLADGYLMRKRYQDEISACDIAWADLIVIFYWKQLNHENMCRLRADFRENAHKLLIGISSHHELMNEWREPGLALLKELAGGVFANNLRLYQEYAPCFEQPFFYTPNGVDTTFFTPAQEGRPERPLRVGWAGSLTNHGNVRGYEECIVPAAAAAEGVELRTAAREDRWRSPEQMRDFYRELDVYLCASSAEGTPNTCLEAAACGVPLLTTRVGNMPELIRDGVNGLFIERDSGDIAARLALLRDNVPLRRHLARSIRNSILEWDWRRNAEHYRAMFEAMLQANGRRQPQPFRSETQLYLASADRMDKVLTNLDALDGLPDLKPATYATIIGGLSGLNYLLKLEPRHISLFDINPGATCYARLICQMIAISQGPRDFISRMFARPVDAYLASARRRDLTVENQREYLACGIDESLLADTLSRLSEDNRRTFAAVVKPHLAGAVEGVRNCRRLLPCWPPEERVPVGAGRALGYDERGGLVPNTNAFFYGHGWLGSSESFCRVKSVLAQATLSFQQFDLFKDDLGCLGDLSQSFVLHVSNIDDWFPDEWTAFRDRASALSLAQQGFFATVSVHGGVSFSRHDAHVRALAGMRPYVFGPTVEVTHKTPWGFGELDRTNVAVQDYLAGDHPADTTILHILLGEGVEPDVFTRVYEKAIRQSSRVIVLEHNRDSKDWRGSDTSRFVTARDLTAMIRSANQSRKAVITAVRMLAGETDRQRNMLVVVDAVHAPPAANDPDRLTSRIEAASPARARRPEISVVLTTYNRPELLEKVLQGFARQTAASDDFEVVVVDDGSVPPVRETADRFAGAVHLKCLRQANSGLAAARNAGIRAAQGAIVLFSDDDDVPAPELIAEHLRSHREHPEECIAVLGRLDWSPDLEVTPLMHYVTHVGGEYFGFDRLQDGQFYDYWKWWGGLISAKRSLLQSLDGPFDTRLRFGYEDTELACRLAPRQVKVLYNAQARSYVLKPVTFEEFCRRSYKQGRALHRVAAEHPETIVPRYQLENAVAEYRDRYAPGLAEWAAKVAKFEVLLAAERGTPGAVTDRHVQALYRGYRECFRGYVLKGYVEQWEAVQRGEVSLGDPVNVEEPGQRQGAARSAAVRSDATYGSPTAPLRPLKITFVDTNTPCFDMGSSCLRIHQIVKILVAQGHQIDYLYTQHFKSDKRYKAAYDGAVRFIKIQPSVTSFSDYLHFNRVDDLDAVWITNLWALDYTDFALQLTQWLKANRPQTKVIVDTMDLHHKKHLRRFELSHDPRDRDTAERFLELEQRLYPLADRVLAVTEVEKRDIRNHAPASNVEVVPNIHEVLAQTPDVRDRRNICFLGAFRIQHNFDAVQWFLKEVHPLLLAQAPDVQVHLLGYGNEDFRARFETHRNVKVVGYVEDAERTVAQYRVFVCPMIYGAGMKGKLGVAAGAGTPFVTTAIGAEGFDFADGQHCFIADEPQEFADKCVRLLHDDALWGRFQASTRDLLERRFSVEAVGRTIEVLLASLATQRGEKHTRPEGVPAPAAAPAPKVSIVMACHNCEDYLPECLDSIRNQTLSEWELFLLDDGSTDGTRRLIEECARGDARIRPFCFESNEGPYVRRNFAIERASSEFIVIQDADDLMSPHKLEVLYRAIGQDPHLAVVGSWYRDFLHEFRGLQYTDCKELPLEHEQIVERFATWRHAMSHMSAIVRRELFRTIGPYDRNPFASDAFWFAKLAEYARHRPAVRLRNVPEYLTLRRVHTGNQTTVLPTVDPRNRRIRYHQYCECKLRRIRAKMQAAPGTDLAAELRNCDCSDFLTRFKAHIIKWEGTPLQEKAVSELLQHCLWLFNKTFYVSCVSLLASLEQMEPKIAQHCGNFDLLRAMALRALEMKEQSRHCLERETRNHDGPAARAFLTECVEGDSCGDVQNWCLRQGGRCDLQYTGAADNAVILRQPV